MSTITVTETKQEANEKVLLMSLKNPGGEKGWKKHEEFPSLKIHELVRGVNAQKLIRAALQTQPEAAFQELLKTSPTVYTIVSKELRPPRELEGSDLRDSYYYALDGAYPSGVPLPNIKPQRLLRFTYPKFGVDARQRPIATETFTDILLRKEREIDVTRLIRDLSLGRDNKNACLVDYICVEDTFVTRENVTVNKQLLTDVDVVVEVYPFYESLTLREFCEKILFKTFAFSPFHYRQQVCEIGIKLLEVVGLLNTFGLYHRDINPDTVLLSYELKQITGADGATHLVPVVKSLRLSNFEYSCALLTDEMLAYVEISNYIGSYEAERSCTEITAYGWKMEYKPTQILFTDPQASLPEKGLFSAIDETSLAVRRRSVNRYWPRLELFACATVLQWILLAGVAPRDVPIKITKTERSFDSLEVLLKEMTSASLLERETPISYVPRLKVVKQVLELEQPIVKK
jgi:serine/threonine protein kinase